MTLLTCCQEAEVRTQAALRLPEVGQNLPEGDRQTILSTNVIPRVSELCADGSVHVRTAVASVLMLLAPVLGQAKSSETLVPLFVRLLKDEVCLKITNL